MNRLLRFLAGLTLLVESQRGQDIDQPPVVGTVRHTRVALCVTLPRPRLSKDV